MTTTSKLPEAFLKRIEKQFPAHFEAILKGFNSNLTTAIQHNFYTGKTSRVLPGNPFGEVLEERPNFAHDPHWHAGAYYVQEASSQHLYALVKQAIAHLDEPLVADFCAAPGGKSLTALNAMEGRGVLWSNEIISSRANVLRENISKWGHGNSIVSSCSAEDLAEMGAQFDLILVDAPCSGEGMFRRDQIAIDEWKPELPLLCAERQESILDNAVACLRPGAYLLYSTCTMAQEENQDQVRRLVHRYGMNVISLEDQNWGVFQLSEGALFTPGAQRGEGLFFCLMQKPEGNEMGLHVAQKKGIALMSKKAKLEVQAHLPQVNLEGHELFESSAHVRAIPEHMLPLLNIAKQLRIPILQAGFALGLEKSGKWIPAHELAILKAQKADLPEVALDYEQAITYLMLNDPKVEGKGWTIATFEGSRLGWLKCIGNRNNNYYPKQWKLRKGIE